MLSFKFKIVLLFLIPSLSFGFNDLTCLSNGFETTVTHKAKPFGLIENFLTVSKDTCVLDINVKKWEVWKRKWSVDICRLPVHIKYGTGAVDIYKRKGSCPPYASDAVGNEYCQKLKELEKLILDEGLIFAKGLKEDLNSEHGKVYCIYLLLQGYLRDGIIYGPESKSIFPGVVIEKVEVVEPLKEEEKSATPSSSF
ncbi:MAG: hypothetical protein DRQ88_01140 [Epsilonproteobacteria bacterium]|nr:MAG: hypothetical protein DRQ89_05205 [Campylobacterota bacterium]RLA67899.1 MAG: hypothetical protein DRQ88_01140 [Campylobacterota bacterium]